MQVKGKRVEVVAQPTKTGYVYVLDRLTGKPMYDVREVPAVASDIPGEIASLTQPEPVKPPLLEPQNITLKDLTNISPEANEFVRKKVESTSENGRAVSATEPRRDPGRPGLCTAAPLGAGFVRPDHEHSLREHQQPTRRGQA